MRQRCGAEKSCCHLYLGSGLSAIYPVTQAVGRVPKSFCLHPTPSLISVVITGINQAAIMFSNRKQEVGAMLSLIFLLASKDPLGCSPAFGALCIYTSIKKNRQLRPNFPSLYQSRRAGCFCLIPPPLPASWERALGRGAGNCFPSLFPFPNSPPCPSTAHLCCTLGKAAWMENTSFPIISPRTEPRDEPCAKKVPGHACPLCCSNP